MIISYDTSEEFWAGVIPLVPYLAVGLITLLVFAVLLRKFLRRQVGDDGRPVNLLTLLGYTAGTAFWLGLVAIFISNRIGPEDPGHYLLNVWKMGAEVLTSERLRYTAGDAYRKADGREVFPPTHGTSFRELHPGQNWHAVINDSDRLLIIRRWIYGHRSCPGQQAVLIEVIRPGEMIAGDIRAKPLGPEGASVPDVIRTQSFGCQTAKFLTWSPGPYEPARDGWTKAEVQAFRERRDG